MKYKIYKFFDKDYPITQYYGERVAYYAQFGLKLGHEGVDYGTPNGTPVLAPFNGVMLRDAFNDKDYGNYAVIWDPIQKIALWFCHLQDENTKQGDSVNQGYLLGHTNNTGNSSGPHCHVNFVETDELGNRLNKNNGNQGFLNLLDCVDFVETPVEVPLEGIDAFLGYKPSFEGQTIEKEGRHFKSFINEGKLTWIEQFPATEQTTASQPETPVETPTEPSSPIQGSGAEPIISPTILGILKQLFKSILLKLGIKI